MVTNDSWSAHVVRSKAWRENVTWELEDAGGENSVAVVGGCDDGGDGDGGWLLLTVDFGCWLWHVVALLSGSP